MPSIGHRIIRTIENSNTVLMAIFFMFKKYKIKLLILHRQLYRHHLRDLQLHIQSDGCHHRTGGLVVELSQPNIMVKTEIGKINLIVFIIYNLKVKIYTKM